MALLAPGALVAGYRIESVLGRGGMGVVYRAVELELDRVVALKVIAPELLSDDDIRARFLREARTAASIEHPNVIPVYAASERDGVAFLVMRFIDGDDARASVRRGGPLAPAQAVDVVARVAAGLDAIHRAGYVHRDVKPANVLVDRDGHVYVTDFGLAKQVLSESGRGTATGQWVGTLDYVAPEQIRGGEVDARADVYALGGVLCFLLTARVPFEREGDEAKLWAQLSEPPPVPSQLRPGLPPALDEVVARAMEKAPDDRYLSAGDLGRAARAALTGGAPSQPERMVARGAAAPVGLRVNVDYDPATVSAARPQETALTVRRVPRRRRWTLPLAVAGVLVAIAVVVVVRPRGDGDPPPPGAPAKQAPAPLRVTDTITDVGHLPNGIAVAGGTVWVTSFDRDRVERIDAATRRKLPLGARVGRGASSIVSDGESVWVAAERSHLITHIDARSGRVVRRWTVNGAPLRLAVGLDSLWVARTVAPLKELVRYDLMGRERDRTRLKHPVQGLAVGPDAVWMVLGGVPVRVLRLDPRTGNTATWATLPNFASGMYFAEGFPWASLTTIDTVARVNPHKPGAAVMVPAGDAPAQVVGAGGRVFVASQGDHRLVVVSAEKASTVGALDVGFNPKALAADEHAVWVTGLGENTVTRVAYD